MIEKTFKIFLVYICLTVSVFGQDIDTTAYYEDLTVPVTSSKSDGSRMPSFDFIRNNGENSHGVFTYWFDYEIEEELFFTVQLPHRWKEGTDIFPHIHWIPESDLKGTNVKWGMEYTWANVGGTFGNTKIIYSTKSVGSIDYIRAFQHIVTELETIPGKGKMISSMLICRVFRDAEAEIPEDNYKGEAGILQIDFHYQVDGVGSHHLYTK